MTRVLVAGATGPMPTPLDDGRGLTASRPRRLPRISRGCAALRTGILTGVWITFESVENREDVTEIDHAVGWTAGVERRAEIRGLIQGGDNATKSCQSAENR